MSKTNLVHTNSTGAAENTFSSRQSTKCGTAIMNMKNIKKILYYSKISLICIILSACQLDVNVPDAGASDPTDSDTPIGSDVFPPDNTPPVISGFPAESVMYGSEYLFIPQSSDADGDNLTFSIEGAPAWLEFNNATGRVWGTPLHGNAISTYSDIVISVSDGIDSSDISFSINVIAPPPGNSGETLNISGTPVSQVSMGQMYTFSPVATGTEHEALSFSIYNIPSWATFDSASGILSGVPALGDEGFYSDIIITVSDSADGFAMLPNFNITVLSITSSIPTISGSPATVAHDGVMYQFIPTSSDLDGDELTFSIANMPNWLNFNTETGELSGIPTANDQGLYQGIVISVSDDESTVSLPDIALMVRSTSVTLTWVAPTARADDSSIDMIDIGGFRVYTGDNLDNMNLIAEIRDPNNMEFVVRSLGPGRHFFTVSAYDIDGLESSFSEAINIDI